MTAPSGHWSDDANPDYLGPPPAKWPRLGDYVDPGVPDPHAAVYFPPIEDDELEVVDFTLDEALNSYTEDFSIPASHEDARNPGHAVMDWQVASTDSSAAPNQILVDPAAIAQGVAALQQRIDKARDINAETKQLTEDIAKTSQGAFLEEFQERSQVLLEGTDRVVDEAGDAVQKVSQKADDFMDMDETSAARY
ncbi:WXG100 family type VII secretion target [Mycobacterium sp.]|uniref:WXG100 family type VII secretion target n=1 Tax=Mycobacterium sp. TaxID=1785 RepID=UPI003BAA5A19